MAVSAKKKEHRLHRSASNVSAPQGEFNETSCGPWRKDVLPPHSGRPQWWPKGGDGTRVFRLNADFGKSAREGRVRPRDGCSWPVAAFRRRRSRTELGSDIRSDSFGRTGSVVSPQRQRSPLARRGSAMPRGRVTVHVITTNLPPRRSALFFFFCLVITHMRPI